MQKTQKICEYVWMSFILNSSTWHYCLSLAAELYCCCTGAASTFLTKEWTSIKKTQLHFPTHSLWALLGQHQHAPFTSALTWGQRFVIVQHRVEEVGLMGFRRLPCGAVIAEDVLAWPWEIRTIFHDYHQNARGLVPGTFWELMQQVDGELLTVIDWFAVPGEWHCEESEWGLYAGYNEQVLECIQSWCCKVLISFCLTAH